MNIFEFMPRPGQGRPIPGGVILCESWSVHQVGDGVLRGEIKMSFQVDEALYKKAMFLREISDSSEPKL